RKAGYIVLRLPLTVEPVFLEWLDRVQPDKKDKIISRIRQMRGGKLGSSAWGERMRGTGEMADQIQRLFRVFAQKYGLAGKLPPLDRSKFRRPHEGAQQLELF